MAHESGECTSNPTFSHDRSAGIYIRDQFEYDDIRVEYSMGSWRADDRDRSLVRLIGG